MKRKFADFFHLTNYLKDEYEGRIAYRFFRGGGEESKTYCQFAMDIKGAAFLCTRAYSIYNNLIF